MAGAGSLAELRLRIYWLRCGALQHHPSGARVTRSPPGMLHHMDYPKCLVGVQKVADAGSGKGFIHILAFRSNFAKKFFDSSTPSLKKVDNGRWGGDEQK